MVLLLDMVQIKSDHMSKKEEHTAFVQQKTWGPDDSYLSVSCQISRSNFSTGDKVKITIEKED